MPQYNRNDLEIAARNQHFTRDTFEKVLRLKTILDWMNAHLTSKICKEEIFHLIRPGSPTFPATGYPSLCKRITSY